jgi:hypothetical protein
MVSVAGNIVQYKCNAAAREAWNPHFFVTLPQVDAEYISRSARFGQVLRYLFVPLKKNHPKQH